ncbi:hypothetical protein BD779DRAFT_643365 [Infundibulicybe gibba]|nr:hypothetical protein BD779DRAFT_643365 [Infundibulicybe gibba]
MKANLLDPIQRGFGYVLDRIPMKMTGNPRPIFQIQRVPRGTHRHIWRLHASLLLCRVLWRPPNKSTMHMSVWSDRPAGFVYCAWENLSPGRRDRVVLPLLTSTEFIGHVRPAKAAVQTQVLIDLCQSPLLIWEALATNETMLQSLNGPGR